MNNPFFKAAKAAWEVLSSKESIQWYKDFASLLFHFLLAFVAVIVIAIAYAVEGIIWLSVRIDYFIRNYILMPEQPEVYQLDQ